MHLGTLVHGGPSWQPWVPGWGCWSPSQCWGMVLTPPPDPTAPHRGGPILPAPPINKGLGSPVAVPGMWGCCGGALPAPPHTHQAQRGSSQSIYWCWPWSELLGLPPALAQTSLVGCMDGGGEGAAMKSPFGGDPAVPPVCKEGTARGGEVGGPGVSTI